MKSLTKPECAEWLLGQDHFLILTHRRPDGDTVGSAAALCLGLRRLGKTAYILANPEITPRFADLHEGLTVSEPPKGAVIVSTDVASANMLPESFAPLAELTALRIDHHGTAASFTPFECVEPGSASCAELIFDILCAMDCPVDKEISEAVYTGLSTDTGCFRFANTTGHSFAVAAKCFDAGADIFRMNQAYFETNTMSKLRIQGWMIEHMERFGSGLCLCAIPEETEKALGVTSDDMDNISNYPRTVEGIQMAATLRQGEPGQVKLSVRSVPGFDSAAVAARFGGGGHSGAAGATFFMDWEEAKRAVRKVMEELQ